MIIYTKLTAMNINQHKGFTLMEVMMVVTIVGILSIVAMPSIGEYIKNQRIKSQMFDVLNALNIARSEAVKRKTTTTFCSTTSFTDCAGSTTWTTGYMIFEDANADATFDVGSDTSINTGAALSGGSNALIADANNIIYRTDGSISTTTTFAICDDRGEAHGREITVKQVGRASIEGGVGQTIADCTP